MPLQNVEVQEKFGDAFRRGDWDLVAKIVDPHISSVTTYREGRAGFVDFFIDHQQALEALEMRE